MNSNNIPSHPQLGVRK